MYNHLANCAGFNEIASLHGLPNCSGDLTPARVSVKEHIYNAVHTNYKVIDHSDNWSQIVFLEAFYIKNLKPSIYEGLKKPLENKTFFSE